MLKPYVLAVPAIILSALIFTLAPNGRSQEAAPTSAPNAAKNHVKPTPESRARAKKLYSMDCEMCHGANGDGKTDLAKDMQLTLLDWTNPKALATKPDRELFAIIRDGKNKMPAEEVGRTSNDDVWNLILYIRSLSKEQAAN